MDTGILSQFNSPRMSSAIGAFTQGVGNYGNQMAKGTAAGWNAKVAGENAGLIGEQGATNTANDAIRNQLALGKQRAAFGQANPGGAGTGTAAIAANQSTLIGNMQTMQDNYKATVARYSAINSENIDNFEAKQDKTSAREGMLSTLLNTSKAFTYGSGSYGNGTGSTA